MANRTKFTRKKRAAFLQHLRETANVTASANAIGISRRRMYDLRDADPELAAEWDAAVEEAVDALELEMRRRALEGTDEPVFYQGEEVGTVRKYSDTLAIFLAKAHRPDKFRERFSGELSGPGGVPLAPASINFYLPSNGRDGETGEV